MWSANKQNRSFAWQDLSLPRARRGLENAVRAGEAAVASGHRNAVPRREEIHEVRRATLADSEAAEEVGSGLLEAFLELLLDSLFTRFDVQASLCVITTVLQSP